MIKRRLGFAGILLAGLILVLYLTGGGKIFGRLGVSRCEKLWKESEEVMVEGEVYQKTRKEEKTDPVSEKNTDQRDGEWKSSR